MSAAATTDLAIPSSRIAGVADRAIDIAAKLTRPVFLDVENVPSRGPFMLVGNHQLLGMQDLPYLVRGLEVLRGVRVRGLADHFHFAVPLWRRWLAGSGAVPAAQGALREAPECLAYEVSHGLEEPDNYVVRIEWSSLEEHELGFREGARFGPFLAAVKPFFEQIEEMRHYKRTSIASAA